MCVASGVSATESQVLPTAYCRFIFSWAKIAPALEWKGWAFAREALSSQRIGSIADAGIDFIKICRRDAIRRHHVDRIAERPQQ
jgi:hypothetical protein